MSDVFRIKYQELSDHQKEAVSKVKEFAEELYILLENIQQSRHEDFETPGSAEMKIAKIKLREAVMWATNSITA